MDVINKGTVGPIRAADGANTSIRMGSTSETIVGQAHGKYYEACIRGNVFTACNVAAQAVSVALNTTYTGLMVSNPVGSGKNLVMISGNYGMSIAQAAIATLHMIAGGSSAGIVTHTTALAAPGIQRAMIGEQSGLANGASGSVARADSAATAVNPYYLSAVSNGQLATALTATGPSIVDFAGQLIVAPGGWIAWGALTAVTGFGSFVWEEVVA